MSPTDSERVKAPNARISFHILWKVLCYNYVSVEIFICMRRIVLLITSLCFRLRQSIIVWIVPSIWWVIVDMSIVRSILTWITRFPCLSKSFAWCFDVRFIQYINVCLPDVGLTMTKIVILLCKYIEHTLVVYLLTVSELILSVFKIHVGRGLYLKIMRHSYEKREIQIKWAVTLFIYSIFSTHTISYFGVG